VSCITLFKWPYLCIIETTKEMRNGREKIMAKNFINFVKTIVPQIQESQQIPSTRKS
jgi:hypothetical protein